MRSVSESSHAGEPPEGAPWTFCAAAWAWWSRRAGTTAGCGSATGSPGEIIAIDDDRTPEVVVRHRSLPLCFDFLPDGRPRRLQPQRALLTPRARTAAWRPYADLSRAVAVRLQRHRGRRPRQRLRQQPATSSSPSDRRRPAQPGFVALVTPDGTAAHRRRRHRLPERHGGHRRTTGRWSSPTPTGTSSSASTSTTDGTLSGRRVWADLGDAAPDGICLDAEGAAWYADVPHQHCVRVAEGGEVLATVALDRGGVRLHARRRRRAEPVRGRRPMARHGRTRRGRAVGRPGASHRGHRPGAGWPARA